MFLDADDQFLPGKMDQMIQYYEKNEHLDIDCRKAHISTFCRSLIVLMINNEMFNFFLQFS
jgi:hypothetical protein